MDEAGVRRGLQRRRVYSFVREEAIKTRTDIWKTRWPVADGLKSKIKEGKFVSK